MHLCVGIWLHFPSNVNKRGCRRHHIFSQMEQKIKELNWAYYKEIRTLHSWKIIEFTMHLRISVRIFTKQPEQSWLHKALNVLSNERKKKKKHNWAYYKEM